MCGLRIIQEVQGRTDGHFDFKEGTPYPALHRLEKRGLSCGARIAARAELRSHLRERTRQLMLDGRGEDEINTQAIQEIGPAPVIARSLRRGEQVHPALSVLALDTLVALLLPLPTLFREQWPTGTGSTTATVGEMHAEGAVTVSKARRQLRPLGIGLTRKDGSYGLTHAGLPDARLGTSGGWCEAPLRADAQHTPTFPFSQIPRDFYVSMPALPACMGLAGWPLDIQGQQVFLKKKALPPLGDNTCSREGVLTMLHAPAIADSLRGLPGKVWSSSVDVESLPAIWPLYWRIRPGR